jgi:hypothetical protein
MSNLLIKLEMLWYTYIQKREDLDVYLLIMRQRSIQ